MNFQNWNQIEPGFFVRGETRPIKDTQALTNDAFTEKWTTYAEEEIAEQEKLFEFQRKWFLELYGFTDEMQLAEHLQKLRFRSRHLEVNHDGEGQGRKLIFKLFFLPFSQ